MKIFFKKNLVILLLSFAGFLCFFLSSVLFIFLPISLVVLAIPSAMLSIRSKRKYDELKNFDPTENIFDARAFDYDEDVYYICTENEKKAQMKDAFSRFNALGPTIIFGFLTIALVVMAIMAFLNI